jgi:hypothetical protein
LRQRGAGLQNAGNASSNVQGIDAARENADQFQALGGSSSTTLCWMR